MPGLLPPTDPVARAILASIPHAQIKAEAKRRTLENGEPFPAVRDALTRQWMLDRGIDPGPGPEETAAEG